MSADDLPAESPSGGDDPSGGTPGEEVVALGDAELVDNDEDGSAGSDCEGAENDPLAALGMEGGIDFGAMMAMAQDMSERMGTAQTELAEARVEGSAGGGLVKVVLNGHLHLLSVEVDPAAADPDDHSVIGDLVVAAWRDAHEEVARMQAAADPLGGLGGALGGGGDPTGGLGGLLGGG